MPSNAYNPPLAPILSPDLCDHTAAHWRWIDWPVRGVRAGYSLRSGGVSDGPYKSFNLGSHVGDDPRCVQSNRLQLAQTLGARPVFLDQVHGTRVQPLPCPDGMQADAAWTDQAGWACCIMVADCLPILVSDDRGRVVGAAHAGWRGLCGDDHGQGVIESLLTHLRAQQADAHWVAWLGPCIGPEAFEVGGDVRQAFDRTGAKAMARFRPIPQRCGKWWCDLPGLARDRLQSLGVTQVWGNDGSADWCTHGRADLYFSHRRDRVSGRMAAAIFLT